MHIQNFPTLQRSIRLCPNRTNRYYSSGKSNLHVFGWWRVMFSQSFRHAAWWKRGN